MGARATQSPGLGIEPRGCAAPCTILGPTRRDGATTAIRVAGPVRMTRLAESMRPGPSSGSSVVDPSRLPGGSETRSYSSVETLRGVSLGCLPRVGRQPGLPGLRLRLHLHRGGAGVLPRTALRLTETMPRVPRQEPSGPSARED